MLRGKKYGTVLPQYRGIVVLAAVRTLTKELQYERDSGKCFLPTVTLKFNWFRERTCQPLWIAVRG